MLYDTSQYRALAAAYDLDDTTPNTLLLSASEQLRRRPYDVTLARLFATICAKLRVRDDE